MLLFEFVIVLLFSGAVLASWARRAKIPYPALLALAGAAVALLPEVPSVVLDPELALALFVAPVLLDAAFGASPRDLKKNWRPVAGLALGAVLFTVAGVALVVRWLEPAMPWPAAIALGAIVAPPDAAAATAVLRQLRLPHRLLVILEGESLFNDASALLIYRMAVGAAVAGSFSPWEAVPLFALVSLGSAVLGVVLARVARATFAKIEDMGTSVIVQFVATFAVWILAERLHLSGIITVVAYGISLARTAPSTPARLRIPSYAVWEVAVFVLNVLAFILIGLQLKPIVERLERGELIRFAATVAAVCATVIVVRAVWVMLYEGVAHVRLSTPERGRPQRVHPAKTAATIAWCGMRGIVTLAAALALPDGQYGRVAFPYRDLILLTAFGVVLVTLVLQGMTLTLLTRLLSLDDDRSIEREVRVARETTAQAALDALQGLDLPEEDAAALRRKYEVLLRRARALAEDIEPFDDAAARLGAVQRHALEAERRALSDLRARGIIGDDAFHQVEEALDWAELNAEALRR